MSVFIAFTFDNSAKSATPAKYNGFMVNFVNTDQKINAFQISLLKTKNLIFMVGTKL